MNVLAQELQKAIRQIEDDSYYRNHKVPGKERNEKYRLGFHLMPPIGWLNDPNGLCQFRGEYHVFFQYCPFDPCGGLKVWGHFISKDLLHWSYLGTPIVPDQPWDCHGVYSGSALVEEDELSLFYTGNVKFPGEYDYIHTGRGANTIMLSSKDGRYFSEKQCILEQKDYPKNYTCHIRDPKVWKDDRYYMVLGGRQIGDKGAVLLYDSVDRIQWKLCNELTIEEPFGYMWECPDLFRMEEDWFLAVSPQGLTRKEFCYQNVYQSGYFLGKGDYRSDYSLEKFTEWDMGFDFYAPQTFTDESGRRILIGWAGLPDIEGEYENPSVKLGWQHALTVPREITVHHHRLYQYPVEEINDLRTEKCLLNHLELCSITNGMFDLEMSEINGNIFTVFITNELQLEYKDELFSLQFFGAMGAGRTRRRAVIKEITDLRVLCDKSLMEIFINQGEYVFTTRYYAAQEEMTIGIDCKTSKNILWKMKEMEVLVENEEANSNW